jgi:hypothetical protein
VKLREDEAEQREQEDVNYISAQILAMTLTDDAPVTNTRRDNLSGFDSHSDEHLYDVGTSSVIDSFGHLALDDSAVNSSTDPTRGGHIKDKSRKQQMNRCTTQALEVLSAVESQIPALRDRLNTGMLAEYTVNVAIQSDIAQTEAHAALQEITSTAVKLRTGLERVNRRLPSVDQRKAEISQQLDALEARITEIKAIMPELKKQPLQFNTGNNLLKHTSQPANSSIVPDHHFSAPIDCADVVAQLSLFLGVVCTIVMSVSRRGGDLIMGVLSVILRTAWEQPGGGIGLNHQNILHQIPPTIEAALARFNLDGQVTIYAVCPKCHYTYKPRYKLGSSIAIYPEKCTNNPHPESAVCNEPLLHKKLNGDQKPIKIFVYHHFHDYLAGLLSRKDIEETMDQACDKLMDARSQPTPDFMCDVFDGQFLRSFEGPDSKPEARTLFVDRQGGGRYVFSLNVDFFCPEGMSVRGATTSCGIISMACLNLPLEIRYKPENMYLAIIPGPREPHLTELNHYLRPVVDDMEVSWEPGVHFSRTALYPTGRMSHSAIAAAVCDLPAARKVAQLAGPSSHVYCTTCKCIHVSTLGRTDSDTWEQRDNTEIRRRAEEWKNAPTSKEQVACFKAHGVRWSEFWRLKYWNPARQLVVDPMHCILEGLIAQHCREILGLTSAEATRKPDSIPAFTYKFTEADNDKSTKDVPKIHRLLTSTMYGSDNGNDSDGGGGDDDGDRHDGIAITQRIDDLKKQLMNKNHASLAFVCQDLNCEPAPVQRRVLKKELVQALVSWVGISFCPA